MKTKSHLHMVHEFIGPLGNAVALRRRKNEQLWRARYTESRRKLKTCVGALGFRVNLRSADIIISTRPDGPNPFPPPENLYEAFAVFSYACFRSPAPPYECYAFLEDDQGNLDEISFPPNLSGEFQLSLPAPQGDHHRAEMRFRGPGRDGLCVIADGWFSQQVNIYSGRKQYFYWQP